MFENEKKIKLTDLIDIEFLQEFQDFFAKTMGVASIAVDDNGPITKPSNFTPFCNKYTRGSKEGFRRCNECDIRWGKFAAKSGKPAIYTCHSGLTDFAVPIMIGGEHVASILGGQILTEAPNEEHFRELARELGIDEDEYVDAVKQIKVVPAATVDAAANFLYLVANAISKIAYKNLELIKKNERESIYRNIIDTIRNSMDISETKQIIVDIIGKTLDSDRCFITEYDKMNDTFLIVQDEYVSSEDIPKYKGANVNNDVPNFMEEFKKGNYLVIDNKQVFINDKPEDFDIEKETIEKVKVNSAYGFPLYYNNELLGVLGLHYIKQHKTNDDEISLLGIIANQIAIALYQAKLYKLTKIDAQRESLLREIIESIRSSLDIEETLFFICQETAKLFNVQRSAITVFPCPENFGEFIIRKEYKSSPEIQGFTEAENPSKLAAFWGKILIKSGEVVAIDNIRESDTPDYFKSSYESIGIKSIMGTPIRKGKNVWGTLVLSEYNNYRHWTDEEKTLLKTISDQVYIAINQAELYEQEQKQSKREQFGRSIIEILRNTIDKNVVKHLFVRSIAKNFNADRVFFSDFDYKNNIYLPIDENSEFLSSPQETSFINQDWSTGSMREYIQPLIEKREFKIACWDEYVKKNVLSEDFKLRFEDANVKSSYNFPVLYEGTIMGFFCIEFVHEGCRKLSDEDISNIRNICAQAGIALYHAELYRKEKETAERERILREVINKIRSSLDIEDIKYEIVNQIGTLFKVDRAIIGYYDYKLQTYIVSERAEYRALECTRSFVGMNMEAIQGFTEYIKDVHLRGENIIFNDLEKHLDDNNLRGTEIEKFYRDFNFTSSAALNIDYGGIFLGNLVISFGQKRDFSEDEINFLRTVADQAGTAFYQAELLDKEKQMAENERILREIMLSLVEAFNFEKIINLIVTEAGKLFKADRCFFVEYDYETDSHPPIKHYAQYLSSEEIRSHVNILPGKAQTEVFIKLIKQKIVVTVDNINEVDLPEATKHMLIEELSVKSYLIAPVYYGEIFYGAIVLHYVNNFMHFTQDLINIANAIANQAAIVIHQAELLEKEKKTAERERILRDIIAKVRSSLDLENIKYEIVNQIGKLFNADRVAIAYYDNNINNYIITKDGEYISSGNVKSFVGVDFTGTPGFAEYIRDTHFQGKDIIFNNLEEYLDEHNLRTTGVENFYKEFGFTSSAAINMYYKDIFIGDLVITFEKQRNILDDEINFLKALADQTGTALYQAQLYENEKQTVEKEKILIEIIAEIKLTQNINQVYNYLIAKLTNIFDVSGVIFIEIPDFKYEKPRVKYECIRNSELPTFQNFEIPDIYSDTFLELAKTLNPLIINDTKNLHADNEAAQKFCSDYSIKSFMATPLVNPTRDVKLPGILAICSSKLRIWTKSEVNLLSVIVASFTSLIWEIKKLNEVDELINTFILTLSKGIQIPLGTQEKTLEVLASQNENQKIGKFKDVIKEALESNKNLFELLTKLLDSYYYESGKKHLNLGHYNMAEVINGVRNDLNELATSKSMTININIDKSISEIDIDKDEIGKVIYSLLENAINYTQNNGIIEIKSYKIGKDIVTCISDNGPGMSLEIKEKIFQRYAATQIIEKKAGSGLGLYLSKLVAEAHGGKIWCESEVGVGTIVCFLLPIQQE